MFGRRSAAPRGRRASPGRGGSRSPAAGADETVIIGSDPSTGRTPVLRRSRGPEPSRPRLLDRCGDWLVTILALRQAAELDNPDVLWLRLLDLKSDFEQRAKADGFNAADIEAGAFAMVAFFDQTILRSRGGARDAWISKPGQLHFYGHFIAGEEFFTRLDRLRRERDSRIEALEVCHASLLLGFVGRYGLEGLEKLGPLIADLEGDIAAVRGTLRDPLAPNAVRREELVESHVARIPIWLTLAIFIPAIVLVWLVVGLIARLHAGNAADKIRQMVGG